MMKKELMIDEYYNWLMDIICIDKKGRSNYKNLLLEMFRKEFTWTIPTDENRAVDGIELRGQFASDFGFPEDFWYDELPGYCTILEMLIALSLRCENSILYDPDIGDRTDFIFWEMLKNLDVLDYTDSHFNRQKVLEILEKFIQRLYGRDGSGNIFCTKNGQIDFRKVEIWRQLNFYISENEL